MLCRLYGCPDATTFSDTWATLMEYVTVHSVCFNWASILVASLHTKISSTLVPDDGLPSKFYMASYLLDAVCSRCHFEGWVHNWDPKQTRPIHLQNKVFWDSRYK